MTGSQSAPDANCYTLPNGECVSEKDCMHGPGVPYYDVCPECGGALENRPLALRCTQCRTLVRKPGVNYDDERPG